VSETSITTTAPSRWPVTRSWSRPGSFGARASERLQRIAREVEDHAEQLVRIGIDAQRALDRADPAHVGVGRQAQRLAHLLDQRFEHHRPAVRRRLLHLAVGERRLAERDRALERAHQLGREALHVRIGHAGEPVGEQLRRGQHVAQVVVDLRHREAERGEMALLLQHRGEVALHRAELALRDADLVVAPGRHDHARRIFRRVAERHHVGGQPVHRVHEQIEQREINQRSR
jgi:hypothetical protein